MSKNNTKHETISLVAYKDLFLKNPLSHFELESKIIDALDKGASYNTICETFNIKSTVIAHIKEKRGMFTKGMFKGLNSAQIALYKKHIKDSENRNTDPLPIDEWLEEQEDTDDDQGEVVDIKKDPNSITAKSFDTSDVHHLVQNDFRVFNALNTMLNEMYTGSKGKLSIAFDGVRIKGFSIEND